MNKLLTMTGKRLNRLVMAISLCEEFTHKVTLLDNGQIVAMVHKKWLLPLEDRLRPHGYRYMAIRSWSCFRFVRVVDSFR